MLKDALEYAEKTRAFPKQGITLTGIYAFINECGGKEVLQGLSTTEVCEKYVKPMTRETQKSYCDQLLDTSSPFIHTGNVFISHAWKYMFLSVIEAMENLLINHPEKPRDSVVFWFDAFSNCQHGLHDPPPFEWWCETFMGAIRDIKWTVMIMSPWDDPITLTRSWCLWEVYCTSHTNTKFEVAMGAEDRKKFEDTLCEDPSGFLDMIGAIDVKRSEAWSATDKNQINDVINKSMGHEELNKSVLECIRNWALATMEQAVVKYTTTYGEAHEVTVKARNGLAMLLSLIGKDNDAERVCMETQRVVQSATGILERNHPELLKCNSALAKVHHARGNFKDAEDLCRHVVKVASDSYPVDHPEILLANEALAHLYTSQGLSHLAEPLLIQALEKRRNAFEASQSARDQRRVIANTTKLAALYRSTGQLQRARTILEDDYNRCRKILTVDHPTTLRIMSSLARVYKDLNENSLAKSMFKACYDAFLIKFGEFHPDTLLSMQSLAMEYYNDGDCKKARAMLSRCVEQFKILDGDDGPYTIAAMTSLAIVSSDVPSRACEIYERAYDVLNKKFPTHQNTLRAQFNLAVALSGDLLSDVIDIDERIFISEESFDSFDSSESRIGIEEGIDIEERVGIKERIDIEDSIGIKERIDIEDSIGIEERIDMEERIGIEERIYIEDRIDIEERIGIEEMICIEDRIDIEDRIGIEERISSAPVRLDRSQLRLRALSLLENCYEKAKQHLGLIHFDTSNIRVTLIKWYQRSRQYDKVMTLLKENSDFISNRALHWKEEVKNGDDESERRLFQLQLKISMHDNTILQGDVAIAANDMNLFPTKLIDFKKYDYRSMYAAERVIIIPDIQLPTEKQVMDAIESLQSLFFNGVMEKKRDTLAGSERQLNEYMQSMKSVPKSRSSTNTQAKIAELEARTIAAEAWSSRLYNMKRQNDDISARVCAEERTFETTKSALNEYENLTAKAKLLIQNQEAKISKAKAMSPKKQTELNTQQIALAKEAVFVAKKEGEIGRQVLTVATELWKLEHAGRLDLSFLRHDPPPSLGTDKRRFCECLEERRSCGNYAGQEVGIARIICRNADVRNYKDLVAWENELDSWEVRLRAEELQLLKDRVVSHKKASMIADEASVVFSSGIGRRLLEAIRVLYPRKLYIESEGRSIMVNKAFIDFKCLCLSFLRKEAGKRREKMERNQSKSLRLRHLLETSLENQRGDLEQYLRGKTAPTAYTKPANVSVSKYFDATANVDALPPLKSSAKLHELEAPLQTTGELLRQWKDVIDDYSELRLTGIDEEMATSSYVTGKDIEDNNNQFNAYQSSYEVDRGTM